MIQSSNRKSEHLRLAIKYFQSTTMMSDVQLLHNSLPRLNLEDIDYSSTLCGYPIKAPIMLNAITGGSAEACQINKQLASTARQLKLPLAVGSQKIGLKNSSARKSFEIVRQENPKGIIFANLGSYATPKMAKEACEMIDADGLQIHLNVPQELAMPEGDRRFYDMVNNIKDIVNSLDLPVIVKEVGFGITAENVEKLVQLDVDAIDISGRNGTDFVKLENSRSTSPLLPSLENWGLTPAQSLLEAMTINLNGSSVIASGGFSNTLDIAKALALNADLIAMAGYPLYLIWNYGESVLVEQLSNMLSELKSIMLICGAKNTYQLRQVPTVISGELREFAQSRNIDTTTYARRKIEKE